MDTSACIGRVGGLAVALGVGVALASGAGAAWADSGSSSAGPSTKSSSSAKHATHKTSKPAKVSNSATGNAPAAPVDTPVSLVLAAAAARRDTTAAGLFEQVVYNPVHAVTQAWIVSDLGQQVDGVVNTLAGSYVIGNGSAGTENDPDGGAGGWLLGDGGAGWNSATEGVAGGNGGAAGFFGTGGIGGNGGAGAVGGSGGAGGGLLGVGGAGGNGGAATAVGGAGGAGGAATGLMFGVGGAGGNGGAGADGGRGGNGGNGASLLGSGGDGGDAGDSGVGGGTATRLPALGGAGGNAGLLGNHGAVGQFGTVLGTSPVTVDGSLPPVTSTGTWLTNSDGQVLILHGVNEVYKVAPFEPSASGFNEDDAAFLAANGFNVVRLGVIWDAVEPEPGVIDTDYLASIQQTVNMLADHGIYTIVDMHQDNYSGDFQGEGAPDWASDGGGLPNPQNGFPGNYYTNPAEAHAWDTFWSNTSASDGLGLEDHYAQTWQSIATYFAGNSAVIGYDVMNEPFAGSGWVAALLGSPFFATQQLTPMYNQVAAAIRSVDPNTALYLEPANPATTEPLNIFGFPVVLGDVLDANYVLAFHDYCAPGVNGLCDLIANQLADGSMYYAEKHHIPAFMGEFGATDDAFQLTTEMGAADKHLISWTEWAYSGKGDITTSAADAGAEALVYDPALPPVGDNVNTGNLVTLAVPYPQVVSGTPNSWSFSDGDFQFSYSTAKVDGSGSFAAGSQTTISVPAVQYPNGYSVSVTGGHVMSAANSPQLVIASDDGATAVSVTVNGVAPGAGVV